MKAVFSKYREILKPLIAEIESLEQRFPTAVLNEIRASFDHISRCYYPNSRDFEENIDRSKGHISRAILDSYKTLIVLFYDQIKEFQKQHTHKDWSTVDGGRFNSRFFELLCRAEETYVIAKGQTDSEQKWAEAYQAYREVSRFLKNPKNVLMVAEGKNVRTWRSNLLWSVFSFLLGNTFSTPWWYWIRRWF